jgi:myo-inositol-1(or 4)-monophosphatase
MLATGFPYDAAVRHVALAHWHAFSYAAQAIRRDGSAAIDLCSVACGRFDGFYESHLGAWDCGAGALIAAEAGATITDYQGRAVRPVHRRDRRHQRPAARGAPARTGRDTDRCAPSG